LGDPRRLDAAVRLRWFGFDPASASAPSVRRDARRRERIVIYFTAASIFLSGRCSERERDGGDAAERLERGRRQRTSTARVSRARGDAVAAERRPPRPRARVA
jgi:hypothetical protein